MYREFLSAAALCCIGLATAIVPAQAQDRIEQRLSAEQMHATGLDTLSAEQLALLNRLLQEPPAQAQASAAATAESESGRSFVGLDDGPIHARVKGTVDGWQPGTVFELDNGQQWRVLKGSLSLRKPSESPEVQIVPGLAGRWFLQLDEDLPKARVYRID